MTKAATFLRSRFRPLLRAILTLSAVANATLSATGFSLSLGIGFGLATLATGLALLISR